MEKNNYMYYYSKEMLIKRELKWSFELLKSVVPI